MIVDRSWLSGWCRRYPPHTFKGAAAQRHGEERLRRALACVTEHGKRVAPWPGWPSAHAQMAAWWWSRGPERENNEG